MKQTKYPVERIIQILSEAELPGSSIAEVCRKYSVSRSAFDKWKQKFKGMSSNDAKRLKVLEDENMIQGFWLKKNWKSRCSEILLKKFLTIHERRVIAKEMIQLGITARKAGDILEIPVSTLDGSIC